MWSVRETWDFLMFYSNYQGSVSASILWLDTLWGKNRRKVHFKKSPRQSESNSIVWKPRTEEAERCKLQRMSEMNLAYRPVHVCREGNGTACNYSNLPGVAENNVAAPGPGPVVIIFKSNKAINYGRNSWLFRISVLMWAKPEARSWVNAAHLGALTSSFRYKFFLVINKKFSSLQTH